MKTIKIQSNLDVIPSYNVDNIESIFYRSMSQKISYDVIDEYSVPVGSYVELRNYDDVLFDEATKLEKGTKLVTKKDEETGEDVTQEETYYKYYEIMQLGVTPDCSTMASLYDQYYDNTKRGIVVIDTSTEVYNEIKVEYKTYNKTQDNGDIINYIRITDIYLNGEYDTVNSAINELEAENPVIFDFDDVYSKVARCWRMENNKKTSAFDMPTIDTSTQNDTTQDDIRILPSFDSGFGNYRDTDGNFIEDWEKFSGNDGNDSNDGNDDAVLKNGNYYILDKGSKHIRDIDYNIFDVLFRLIYDYVYMSSQEQHSGTDVGSGSGSTTNAIEPDVIDPSNYTFLLKTYKMYVKQSNTASRKGNYADLIPVSSTEVNTEVNDINNNNSAESVVSYTAEVLNLDEIKELTAEEAQEYFNNTILQHSYKNKLILTSTQAKNVLIDNNVTKCGKYFIVSDNAAVQCPADEHHEYYDIGNFELKRFSNTYKYTTEGKIVRIQQIYDPLSAEYYTISQNNSGEFPKGYELSRYGVCIRGNSGKEDFYYFEKSDEGLNNAKQLQEDILYAMEDGPSIVFSENLIDIEY